MEVGDATVKEVRRGRRQANSQVPCPAAVWVAGARRAQPCRRWAVWAELGLPFRRRRPGRQLAVRKFTIRAAKVRI